MASAAPAANPSQAIVALDLAGLVAMTAFAFYSLVWFH
jgi:hypothetical protein